MKMKKFDKLYESTLEEAAGTPWFKWLETWHNNTGNEYEKDLIPSDTVAKDVIRHLVNKYNFLKYLKIKKNDASFSLNLEKLKISAGKSRYTYLMKDLQAGRMIVMREEMLYNIKDIEK